MDIDAILRERDALRATLAARDAQLAAVVEALEKHACGAAATSWCGKHHQYHKPDIDAALAALTPPGKT
jgi:hypothetical protein